jgi:uncharacterized protein HemX
LTCVHGACNSAGVCECADHFGGPNCDVPVTTTGGTTGSNQSVHHSNTATIVVPILFFVVIAVGLAGVYWYKYRRNRTPQFRSLDLVEGESLLDDDEPQEPSKFANLKAKLRFDN